MAAPPAALARRLAVIATTAAAVVVPLIYAPALEAPFVVPKLAVLEVMAALGFLAFALQIAAVDGARWSRPAAVGAGLVLCTTAAAWAMTPRAPYAVPALARWAALFGVACAAVLVSDDARARQRLLEAITGAAAVVSVIGILQHLELAPLPIPVISAPGATFGNRNLAAEAVAMSLPLGCAAVAAARGPALRRGLVGALILELVYLAATRARGAWLGGALGLLTLAALAPVRLAGRRAVLVAGAIVLAALAGLLPGRLNPRFVGDSKRFASGADVVEASFDTQSTALRTRLGLWRRGLAIWRDHPIWGAGPGNWPVVFPKYAEPGATRDGVLSMWLAPRQAHNDIVERAGETGLVGVGGLAALCAGAIIAIRRRLAAGAGDRTTTAAAAGALAALAGTGLTGFPLEMPATIALSGLALGLVAASPIARSAATPDTVRGRRRAGRAAVAVAGLLLLGAGWRAQQQLRGSAWLAEAERAMGRDSGANGALAALPRLERAATIIPRSFRVYLRTAQMMRRLDRPADAQKAIRRALALEPFSPNAWATLGAAELDGGQDARARASAARALVLLADHPFALFVAARAAEATGDRNDAAASWQRLYDLASESTDRDTAEAARSFVRAHKEGRAP
jgi:O-antigen ligase/cytochrome c-type biogenesis protein CcmH/NrfG